MDAIGEECKNRAETEAGELERSRVHQMFLIIPIFELFILLSVCVFLVILYNSTPSLYVVRVGSRRREPHRLIFRYSLVLV